MPLQLNRAFLILAGIFLISTLNAYSQFTLSGSAVALGDSCYRLTPDLPGQVGSIWSTSKVSLLNSFEIYTYINFGNKDVNGADGMTFSLQPINNTVGTTGKGMGMEGISPSFFVEFDTYQNSEIGDPSYDHMNIFKNGVVDHTTPNNLVGPDSILPSSANVEDSTDHLLHFIWNASTHTFQVYVDCSLRQTYTGDLINTIFSGNSDVYWGFTGSTGALTNDQSFCFLYIYFENTDEKEICKGDSVQLYSHPGNFYNWRPYAGLSDFSIQNPKASPDTTTMYYVKYIDLCGNTGWDTVFVNVRVPEMITDSVFICQGDSALVDGTYITEAGTYITDTLQAPDGCDSLVYQTYVGTIPLPETGGYDTTFCPPDDFVLAIYYDSTASYSWSNGDSGPTATVSEPGHYYVDITKNGCTQRSYFNLVESNHCEVELLPANIFSPNNDGVNDLFPGITEENIATFQMTIFNRWGKEVYRSDDILRSWDGSVNGTSAPEGVYYYVINYSSRFKPGENTSLSGSLTLVR